jgi:hypothetical protein
MNHAKTLASIVVVGLLAVGCSGYGTKMAGPEDYNKARANAITSLDGASKLHNEWRDSRKILDESEKAAKEGDFAKAVQLADKAKRQGDLAILQASSQKSM